MIILLLKVLLILLVAILLLKAACNIHKYKRSMNTGNLIGASHYIWKRRWWFALAVALYFGAFVGLECLQEAFYPRMMVKFNFEEAAKGQNPNKTRFNVSKLLSEDLLEKVIARGGFTATPEQLSDCLSLESVFDEEEIDVEEGMLNIATEYNLRFKPDIHTAGIDGKQLMSLLADIYYEEYIGTYSENSSILDLTFDDIEAMDYLDIDDYLRVKAEKLQNYISIYAAENSNYRLPESGETFSGLSQKITNFMDVELERYQSYVLQNGFSKDPASYRTRMDFNIRKMQTEYEKNMASYSVRLEAIDLYDAQMARIVLVPTSDEAMDFYMSRTKIGVDYFADEAKDYLNNAVLRRNVTEHNQYARNQIEASGAGPSAYEVIDVMTQSLITELNNLSEQCRVISESYIKEKRDGYLQLGFVKYGMFGAVTVAKIMAFTMLFVIAAYGYLLSKYLRSTMDMDIAAPQNREDD